MKNFSVWTLGLFIILYKATLAQDTRGQNDTIRVGVTLVNDEYIPWVPLKEVIITSSRSYKSVADLNNFLRLKRDVLKVRPYALLARNKYTKLQRDLALTSNKTQQRLLVKACNEEIKTLFNREIKELTITQGGILIKLIDREIGSCSYEILRELKGSFTAFLYQSVARVFGHNLKREYDLQQDRDIESILQSLDTKE